MGTLFTQETSTHAHTDGSTAAAIQGGGTDIYILFPSGRMETTGKYCIYYRAAQVEAIMEEITLIAVSQEDCSHVVILTESMSVLGAIRNSKL